MWSGELHHWAIWNAKMRSRDMTHTPLVSCCLSKRLCGVQRVRNERRQPSAVRMRTGHWFAFDPSKNNWNPNYQNRAKRFRVHACDREVTFWFCMVVKHGLCHRKKSKRLNEDCKEITLIQEYGEKFWKILQLITPLSSFYSHSILMTVTQKKVTNYWALNVVTELPNQCFWSVFTRITNEEHILLRIITNCSSGNAP
jgi:hypothetical protein